MSGEDAFVAAIRKASEDLLATNKTLEAKLAASEEEKRGLRAQLQADEARHKESLASIRKDSDVLWKVKLGPLEESNRELREQVARLKSQLEKRDLSEQVNQPGPNPLADDVKNPSETANAQEDGEVTPSEEENRELRDEVERLKAQLLAVETGKKPDRWEKERKFNELKTRMKENENARIEQLNALKTKHSQRETELTDIIRNRNTSLASVKKQLAAASRKETALMRKDRERDVQLDFVRMELNRAVETIHEQRRQMQETEQSRVEAARKANELGKLKTVQDRVIARQKDTIAGLLQVNAKGRDEARSLKQTVAAQLRAVVGIFDEGETTQAVAGQELARIARDLSAYVQSSSEQRSDPGLSDRAKSALEQLLTAVEEAPEVKPVCLETAVGESEASTSTDGRCTPLSVLSSADSHSHLKRKNEPVDESRRGQGDEESENCKTKKLKYITLIPNAAKIAKDEPGPA